MVNWLYKTIGTREWLLVTEKGVETVKTRTKLIERLKELGVKVNRCSTAAPSSS